MTDDNATDCCNLPLPLIARCVSYNVETTADIANLRGVCRSFGRMIKGCLPNVGERRGHSLQFPPKRAGENAFVTQLLDKYDPDDLYEAYHMCLGDHHKAREDFPFRVFSDAILEELILLGAPDSFNNVKEKLDAFPDMNGLERMSKSKELCQVLRHAKTVEEFKEASKEVERLGLMKPYSSPENPISLGIDKSLQSEYFVYPCLVALRLPKNSSCIEKTTRLEDGTEILHLTTFSDFDAMHTVGSLDWGCSFLAPVLYSDKFVHRVQVLIKLVGHCEVVLEAFWSGRMESVSSIGIGSVWQEFQNKTFVEGVAVVDEIIGPDLQKQLMSQIDTLASRQEEQNGVDYHPNSNNVVRDVVHPALYSYVVGVSPLRANVNDLERCIFAAESWEAEDGTDFWGRKYEASKYQWLPTYFQIAPDGRCKIENYINNLVPRDDPVNSAVYEGLTRLFEQCVPYMEAVYSYVRAIRPCLREEGENGSQPLASLGDIENFPFRGQQLQVITKIVDYELKPGQSYEGVWHVEGMSHEEIVLTALYILDRDDDIDGGLIEFKRAYLKDEAEYVFSNVNQTRPPALEALIDEGLVPLGKVETSKGRLIVFPNSHVHRVGGMINTTLPATTIDEDDTKESLRHIKKANMSRRRIVVFFLVNPMCRIVSTREVAPQQRDAGGRMPHEEALQHRLELMKERKFTKQDWNVREIELCEH